MSKVKVTLYTKCTITGERIVNTIFKLRCNKRNRLNCKRKVSVEMLIYRCLSTVVILSCNSTAEAGRSVASSEDSLNTLLTTCINDVH